MNSWEQLRALEGEEGKVQSLGEWLSRKEVGGAQGLGGGDSVPVQKGHRRRVEKPPPRPPAWELEGVSNGAVYTASSKGTDVWQEREEGGVGQWQ